MTRLEQLRQAKAQLEAQLQELIRVIGEYERLEAKARAILGPSTQDVDGGGDATISPTLKGPSTRAKRPEVAVFEAVVREVLSEAKAPMDRTEVLEAVRARGVTVGGVEPANTVSARLSRMDDVRSQRGVGYWLISRADDFARTKTDALDEPDDADYAQPRVFSK